MTTADNPYKPGTPRAEAWERGFTDGLDARPQSRRSHRTIFERLDSLELNVADHENAIGKLAVGLDPDAPDVVPG